MQHPLHWRDAALIKSEGITDAWEVTKTYAGRLAEWILFLCMILNIVEILPGVQLAQWVMNTVLGIQAVTLDVAGFGLATMAEQAAMNGDEETARSAKRTAYLLIGLMMITVLTVSIGTLWPHLKPLTDLADKGLILVRVGMTVVYGHVVHGLRRHENRGVAQHILVEWFEHINQDMRRMESSIRVSHGNEMAQLDAKVGSLATAVSTFSQPVVPDMTLLMEQIASLSEQVMQLQQHLLFQEDGNIEAQIVDMEDYREAHQCEVDESEVITVSTLPSVALAETTKKATVTRTLSTSNGRGEARQKALRLLKKQPQLTATELAKKAQITRQYASKLLSEVRNESNAGNQ